MRRFAIIPFLFFGIFSFAQTFTLSGYVKEEGSLEHLLGVAVYDSEKSVGTTTNKYGFYSITLPAGTYNVTYSFMGFLAVTKKIELNKDVENNVLLGSSAKEMETAVVKANKTVKESERVQMSSIEIPIKQIKDIPTLLGEKDVLKVIQLMPGVQSGGEGQSGIYVRGGGPDQNLIILDDAVVYNATHLFGFFSLFNGDALKSVELIKGGFPARYGGRLSSVIDMNMKEGNRSKYKGEFGIGVLSSRGVFEGPLPGSKGKGSFIISGRRTYIDALLQPIILSSSGGEETGGYFFYDLNAKVNYDITPKDRLYISSYLGRDKFYYRYKFNGDKEKGSLGWGNVTGTVRWNRQLSNKAFANTSFILSNYSLGIRAKTENSDGFFDLRFGSDIKDYGLKHDIDFYPNPKHSIKAGAAFTYHRFNPNALVVKGTNIPDDISSENITRAFENGVYVEDVYKPTNRLKLNGGLRLSHFNQGGENYFKLEPRIAAAFSIKSDLSVKASYANMNQYIHLLSNTGIGLPTDLWVPATERVRPQSSSQIAAGVAKDFKKLNLSLTLEGYYKKMDNILSYKEGTSFLDPEETKGDVKFADWQDKVTSGVGESYGGEVFLQRKFGKFSGWLGYTISWTQLQFDDLNNGKPFWAKYDRRHDVSVVGIYKLNNRVKFSAVWVYGTGNAISVARSEYQSEVIKGVPTNGTLGSFFDSRVYDYGDKNSFRMRAYHRLDIGVQLTKEKKKGRIRTWEFSAYNAYNRANPFFYMRQVDNPDNVIDSGDESVKLYQVTLFPIIPSLSYSLKFN